MTIREIQARLRKLGNPEIAEHSQRFFKTGKGEYGEGDRFLGIRVPVLRSLVREFKDISLKQIQNLLQSPYHEERLFSLFCLVDRFKRSDDAQKAVLHQFYMDSTQYINNWDLVDCAASDIVGGYLMDRDKQPIYHLARSHSLWERRIAIISTFYMIRRNRFDTALEVAGILKDDIEDLVHKAVGWMLREVGKRDMALEKKFLADNYKKMPRTMLRYAIERFPAEERKRYLA
jgi:3-methyladenine DNA glycosylase AlkD